MSRTGKTLLLSILFLGLSGAKIHAQGPLLPIKATSKTSCTMLNSYFVATSELCEDKKLSQRESIIKAAAAEDKNPETVTFSYAVEPTYYVEPTPTVTPAVLTATTPAVLAESVQAPRDLLPAAGPSLDANMIFDLINAHRASIGKPAFLKDDALCSLAQTRSLELSAEFANGSLHSGLYNRGLPYWITENAKWGSNEAGTVRWWLNSPIHRSAIQGDLIYSCGACNGTQCSQLFTSYTPKQTLTVKTVAPTQ